MTRDEFDRFCYADPFRPFSLTLPDGRIVEIIHRDFVNYWGGRVVHIYQQDLRLNVVDLMLVADLELPPPEEGEWPYQE